MRIYGGMVGLLVVVGIVALLLFGSWGSGGRSYTRATLEEGKKAREQVMEISGRDEENMPATESIAFAVEPNTPGGPVAKIVVNSVNAKGAMERRYGLKAGDEIVEVGPLRVRDDMTTDDAAKDYLNDGFGRGYALTVIRDGQRVVLNAK